MKKTSIIIIALFLFCCFRPIVLARSLYEKGDHGTVVHGGVKPQMCNGPSLYFAPEETGFYEILLYDGNGSLVQREIIFCQDDSFIVISVVPEAIAALVKPL